MTLVDLVRIERSQLGDQRYICSLRQRAVESIVILGLLDHDQLEGHARSEALFLTASIKNDFENARLALARLSHLHAERTPA